MDPAAPLRRSGTDATSAKEVLGGIYSAEARRHSRSIGMSEAPWHNYKMYRQADSLLVPAMAPCSMANHHRPSAAAVKLEN
jgi:hypothetical protein